MIGRFETFTSLRLVKINSRNISMLGLKKRVRTSASKHPGHNTARKLEIRSKIEGLGQDFVCASHQQNKNAEDESKDQNQSECCTGYKDLT